MRAPAKGPESWMYPRFVIWELTLACNMRCSHCGSKAGGPSRRSHELTTEEALEVADQLAALGTEDVTLSGGELFLRRDWDQIAARLTEHGLEVKLLTNGLLLPRHLERIRALPHPVVGVGISLDGTRATHDAIRGVKGSFDRVVQGYLSLRDAGILAGCVTSVSRRNLGELQGIYDELVRCGVVSWQLQLVIGEGRMRNHPDMPDPAAIEPIIRFMVEKKREGRMAISPGDNLGFYTELDKPLRNGEEWEGCGAGTLVMGIEANGNVKGCLSQHPELTQDNPFVEGNVREHPLEAIWNRPGAFAYNRQFDAKRVRGFCRGCEHLERCRCGCTATAYAIHGTKYENAYCVYQCRALAARGEQLPTYASCMAARAGGSA